MHEDARRALAEGWPIALTGVVVGIAFGIAARSAGLSPLEASAMSFIIFAGAAQFAALDLISRDAPVALVVASVLLINLRHLLMGTAIRTYWGAQRLRTRLLGAYLLTDESFALGVAQARRGPPSIRYYLAFAAFLWACWNAGTLLGATVVTGGLDARQIGLDFAIAAAFLAILTLGARGRLDVVVAVTAALIAAALRLGGLPVIAVVVAAALAPLVALAWRR